MDLSKTTRFRNFCVTKDDGIVYCSIDPRRNFSDPLLVDKIDRERNGVDASMFVSTDISFEQFASPSPNHASLPNTPNSFLTTSSRSSSVSSIISCTNESNLQESSSLVEPLNLIKSPFKPRNDAEVIVERPMPSTPKVPTILLNGNEIFEFKDVRNCKPVRKRQKRQRRYDCSTIIPSESMTMHKKTGKMSSSPSGVHFFLTRVTPSVPEVTSKICCRVPSQNLIPKRFSSPRLSGKVLPLANTVLSTSEILPSKEYDVKSSVYREYPSSRNIKGKAHANRKHAGASKPRNCANMASSNDKEEINSCDELKLSPYITPVQAAERQRILGTKKAQHEINVFAAIISARVIFEKQVEANHAAQNDTISLPSTFSKRPATTMTHPASQNFRRERFERISEDAEMPAH